MSNYYGYSDVKVMIAERLMSMEGWKVYGYYPDNSDPMTDYWDPAYWCGIAKKNGFVLCVDVSGEEKPREIKKYTGNIETAQVSRKLAEKIAKLEQMTAARGASDQEEATARAAIEKLRVKAAESAGATDNNYTVIDIQPGHMANPPRCNWHIEKDGIIIAKGNGILKYAHIESYFKYPHYKRDMDDFKSMSRDEYRKEYIADYMRRFPFSLMENVEKCADSHINEMAENEKLYDDFLKFIGRIDTACGGMLGDGFVYEKVKVTEYRKENKAVETATGSIKEGQCFVVKTSFNYGHSRGLVYRIHETGESHGHKLFHAYKLNRKLDKECAGRADSSNHWYITEDFMKWFDKGALAFCEIKEVKTPYEVEKVVKKKVESPKAEPVKDEPVKSGYTYDIKKDTDSRDGSDLWVVRIKENLDRDAYIEENKAMKERGGYYSRFKKGFIFRFDPSEILNIA